MQALLQFRLKTVRVGVQTTWLALALLSVYSVLPGGEPSSRPAFFSLIGVAAVGGLVVSRLPWERLFQAGWGTRLFYGWSVLDIVLITLAILLCGGATSPLILLYVLTTLFFAASYAAKSQAVLLGFTFACYLVVVAVAPEGIDVGGVFVRMCGLGLTEFMGAFLSRQLMAQTAAHAAALADSEERAALLAEVASAARSMSTLDPERLLEAVVGSSVAIGFDAAEICMFDEEAGTWSQAYHRGLDVEGATTTRDINDGVVGEVYRRRSTVVLDDYSAWDRGLDEVRSAWPRTTIACPVWTGSELAGVLVAGTVDRRTVPAHRREALELLAAQASAALVIARRYSERQGYEAQLLHQATHDSLTGLPNRSLLFDRIDHAITGLERGPGSVAVLFLDLDRFKTINDSLGHDAGDEVLARVAERLKTCVRPRDTVARYGGDEFVVVLDQVTETEAVVVANRILTTLSGPCRVSGRDLHVTPSIGIAFSGPKSGADCDVLRQADLAMYRAKEGGGARWEIYIDEMSAEAVSLLDNELDLRRAVEDEELSLLFQPVVDLATGQVVGVEALVRWHHPERGVVSPAEFIPLAESTGLIVPLGRWVLREAMAQARRWEDQGIDIGIAVNISAVQFRHPGLVRAVTDALRASEIRPSKLTLEITETVVMQELDVAVAAMGDLGCLGVNFALDDFGQGYSSLGYLKAFPLKTVKIDRSFVRSLVDSPEDQAIVRSVVSLSRELGMTVVAEGVETVEQLEQVRRLGCDEVQGYYYAPPLRADEVARMVRTSRRVGATVGAVAPTAG